MESRRDKAIRLRQEGWTFKRIGWELGVSTGRAWQLASGRARTSNVGPCKVCGREAQGSLKLYQIYGFIFCGKRCFAAWSRARYWPEGALQTGGNSDYSVS